MNMNEFIENWMPKVLIAIIAVVTTLLLMITIESYIGATECYVVATPNGYALVNASGVIDKNNDPHVLSAVGRTKNCMKKEDN